MQRKKTEKPDDDLNEAENKSPLPPSEEIKKIHMEMKVINSLLMAPLAFENIPDKVHMSWKKQLKYCEDRLNELKAPLKIRRK